MACANINFLIVIKFLLENTDENHMSSSQEIIKYAKSKFNVTIDGRTVCKILQEIKNFVDKYPCDFPFILNDNGGVRKKYYIEQKNYSLNEIKQIIDSINNNTYLPQTISNALINKIIASEVSVHEAKQLTAQNNNRATRACKISEEIYKNIRTIEDSINRKCLFIFTDKKDGKNHTVLCTHITFAFETAVITYIEDGEIKVFNIDDVKNVKLDPITCDENKDINIKVPQKLYGAKTPYKTTIDSIFNSEDVTCEFTFDNTKEDIDAVCELYKEHFNENLTYVIKGGECHAKVLCNENAFCDWATDISVLKYVSVKNSNYIYFKIQIILKCANLLYSSFRARYVYRHISASNLGDQENRIVFYNNYKFYNQNNDIIAYSNY